MKAVHAPVKPTRHLSHEMLYYLACGCPWGCEAAQDRLTSSTYCQAFKCLCFVSILASEGSSLGLPSAGSSTNAFLQGALQLFAFAE